MYSNAQVERRAVREANEADLSTSIPSDDQRRRPACPLQPLVRRRLIMRRGRHLIRSENKIGDGQVWNSWNQKMALSIEDT
jgi:hypothetical protein